LLRVFILSTLASVLLETTAMPRLSWIVASVALAIGCGSSSSAPGDGDEDDGEPADEAALATVSDADETGGALAAVPLDDASGFVDLRGVGDSGWTRTHVTPAPAAGFGAALERFDGGRHVVRGDLSFMNWETVVADACTTFSKPYVAGQSYAFISRAENLNQALDAGFNLFGLANNHARDCTRTGDGLGSIESTTRATQALASESRLFHGVGATGSERRPAIGVVNVRGRALRVAFASGYLGIARGAGISAKDDLEPLMQAMQAADVDLRILALHSVDDANQALLASVGATFVTRYGGDVVLGSGPHAWRPVRVLRKPNGKTGVVFESLGNFLHPALAAQAKNFVGRVLFDASSLAVRQVQLVAVQNRGDAVVPSTEDPAKVAANLRWSSAPASGGLRVVYADVRD
jgi:poly-gamma-glutamate synthesis protein (capsule biosynthesis protein)